MSTVVGYFALRRPDSQIRELDGLRAIAIILVLLRHGVNPFRERGTALLPLAGWDLSTPFTNGWAGVDLFFVLSGYLITAHLLRRQASGGGVSVTHYLSQRALRIVPAYFAVLAIAAAGVVPHFEVRPGGLRERVAYHLLFLQDYLPADIVVAFWSLGVEEKFYLTIPLLLAALAQASSDARRWILVAALIAVVPILRVATATQSDVSTYLEFFSTLRSPAHLNADALLVGTLTALLAEARTNGTWRPSPWVPRLLFGGGLALVTSLLIPVPHMDHIGWLDRSILTTLLAIGFGGMVLAVAAWPGQQASWLRGYGLHVIARLSYSLYLVHLLLIPAVQAAVGPMADARGWSAGAQFAAFLPVYLVASTAAALLLHYGVEKPFLLLKERLAHPRAAMQVVRTAVDG